MPKAESIPEMYSYKEIGEFWDDNDLGDFWEHTEPVSFEVSSDARRRYLIAVDPDMLRRAQQLAKKRGLSTESLVNILLEQSVRSLEVRHGSLR
ncbi:MAG: hypothetical protein GY759_16760 [Chloroflexi bacterium]|nr:hypothetical protein [Chloroflexota bacterium]